jgi:predicted esterase
VFDFHKAYPWRTDFGCIAPLRLRSDRVQQRLPPDVAARLGSTPPAKILLFHGRDDRIVPLAKSREAATILQAHSHAAELVEFDGGHYIPSLVVEWVADDQ